MAPRLNPTIRAVYRSFIGGSFRLGMASMTIDDEDEYDDEEADEDREPAVTRQPDRDE